MCTTCGCGDPEIVSVELHDRILATNDRRAAHNREHFSERGVLVVNLMGSPGAGKVEVVLRQEIEQSAHRLAHHRTHVLRLILLHCARVGRRRRNDGTTRKLWQQFAVIIAKKRHAR